MYGSMCNKRFAISVYIQLIKNMSESPDVPIQYILVKRYLYINKLRDNYITLENKKQEENKQSEEGSSGVQLVLKSKESPLLLLPMVVQNNK